MHCALRGDSHNLTYRAHCCLFAQRTNTARIPQMSREVPIIRPRTKDCYFAARSGWPRPVCGVVVAPFNAGFLGVPVEDCFTLGTIRHICVHNRTKITQKLVEWLYKIIAYHANSAVAREAFKTFCEMLNGGAQKPGTECAGSFWTPALRKV